MTANHRSARHLRLWLLGILAFVAQTAAAADWKPLISDDFERSELGEAWVAAGGNWTIKDGALAANGGNDDAIIMLKQELLAPAIRVEYDCWFDKSAAGGAVSDLSCSIGATSAREFAKGVFFAFATNNNEGSRLGIPGIATEIQTDFKAVPGTRHRVVAEANGTVMTMWVDGKVAAQEEAPRGVPLGGKVGFYVWSNGAHFDNIKVLTKDKPDPPAGLLVPKPKPKATGPPEDLLKRFAKLWKLSDLKTSDHPAAVARQRVPLWTESLHATKGFPVTFGVPFPKEQVWKVSQMRVVDEQGREVECSITPTATWTEAGSLKWVLLDMQPAFDAPGKKQLFLEYGNEVTSAEVKDPIKVTQDGSSITVDTGAMRAVFSKTDGSVIQQVMIGGKEVLDAKPQAAGLSFTDQNGVEYVSQKPDTIEVEFQTPMRAVVRAKGWYANAKGEKACLYETRAYLYRGQPVIRLFNTWTITVDTDTMQWSDLALRVPFSGGGGESKRIAFGKEQDDPAQFAAFDAKDQPLIQTQTEIRTSVIEAAGNPRKEAVKSKEAAGWVDVSGTTGGLTLSVIEMAGQFPNALEVRDGQVIFHGFSNKAGHNLGFRNQDIHDRLGEEAWAAYNKSRGGYQAMELRYSNGKGLAKTHEMVLTFRPQPPEAGDQPNVKAAQLAIQSPIALADPKWNCDSMAFGPFHPVDRENFPQIEAKLDKALADWLHLINHMSPHYGFYDHGRGLPHNIGKPTKAPDGEDVFFSDGYRRNYDMGYGNTMSPWLGFLRSGDRRWLSVGNNMLRHEMDVRHVHPTDTPGKFKVGMKYWHYGWWSFDGSCCGFGPDSWYKGLALCYYTTGYQRSMDVYAEIMDSLYHEITVTKTFKVGPDYTTIPTMCGSAAIFYAATWNPKYHEMVEMMAPTFAGGPKPFQLADGRYNVRIEWIGYGYFETMSNVPEPPAVMAEPYRRFNLSNARVPERVFMWEFSPHSLWSHYQQTKDPQAGALAHYALDRYENYYGITFISFDGLERLWFIPVYMNLAANPNIAQAKLYDKKEVTYPQHDPICIKHEKGKPTVVEFVYKQLPEAFDEKMLQAFDEKGQPVSQPIFKLDSEVRVYGLKVPADAPSQVYRIQATLPPQRSIWNYDEALTMPWQPDAYPVMVKWQGDSPVVADPKPAPKEKWVFSDPDPKFPAGKFGRGIRVSKERGVKIPLGAAADAPWSKQFFNGQRGTLEFWVRFERPTLEGGFGGTLVSVPSKGFPAIKLSCAENWHCALGNVEGTVRPIYDLHPQIEPGRWYHLAIIWDHNIAGQGRTQVLNRVFLDGVPAPTVQSSDKLEYMDTAGALNEVLGPLMFGGIEGSSFVTIDEVRVSSEPRYPRGWVRERAFVPPDKPFEFDDKTLLLGRFEDNRVQTAAGEGQLELVGF